MQTQQHTGTEKEICRRGNIQTEKHAEACKLRNRTIHTHKYADTPHTDRNLQTQKSEAQLRSSYVALIFLLNKQ